MTVDAVTATDMKNVRTDHKHETCEKKTGRQTAVTSCHFHLLSSILPSCTHVSDTFIIYHHKRVLAEGMAASWQCVTCQDNCKDQDEQKILTGLADLEPTAALLAATSTRSPPASHNTHTLDRYAVLLYTADILQRYQREWSLKKGYIWLAITVTLNKYTVRLHAADILTQFP